MRVALTTYDSRGGIEPLLALAVRLRERGAEVLMCTPADCAERIAELGIPFVPYGMTVRELVHGAKPPSPSDVPRRAAELMTALFDTLVPAAQGYDALVVSGVMSVAAAGRSVAEALGARSELMSLCPIFVPSPDRRPFGMPLRPLPEDVTDNAALQLYEVDSYNMLFGESLNANRARFGLPPVDDVRAHVYADRALLAADPVLAPLEVRTFVEVVQTGAWFVPDERPLPARVEAFLDAGEPPVYVSLGSLRAPDGFAEGAVEAVRAHGRRLLLGSGWAGLDVEASNDVATVGEVNQQALFRRVAAAVHHGGAGTTHTATAAGVPQVVVPQMADQPYWGSRVAALGIGAVHDGPAPTVESLSAALATALATRERATEVAATIRTDGADVAASLLLGG